MMTLAERQNDIKAEIQAHKTSQKPDPLARPVPRTGIAPTSGTARPKKNPPCQPPHK